MERAGTAGSGAVAVGGCANSDARQEIRSRGGGRRDHRSTRVRIHLDRARESIGPRRRCLGFPGEGLVCQPGCPASSRRRRAVLDDVLADRREPWIRHGRGPWRGTGVARRADHPAGVDRARQPRRSDPDVSPGRSDPTALHRAVDVWMEAGGRPHHVAERIRCADGLSLGNPRDIDLAPASRRCTALRACRCRHIHL